MEVEVMFMKLQGLFLFSHIFHRFFWYMLQTLDCGAFISLLVVGSLSSYSCCFFCRCCWGPHLPQALSCKEMIFFSGHSQQDEAAGGSAGLSRERAIEGYRESWAVNRKYWDEVVCFLWKLYYLGFFRDFCCSAIRRVLILTKIRHDSQKLPGKCRKCSQKRFFPLQGCQVDWRFRVQTLFCKDKRGGMRNLIPTAGLSKGELGVVFLKCVF